MLLTELLPLLLLFSTWSLFKDSAIAILDGVPTDINPLEIKDHLQEVKGVINIHHLHIWGISTNENALTAHIQIEDVNQLPKIKKALKEELEEHNIKHSTLEFELLEENCTETTL
jgi:cobalt-zinc-cadmium efflux system protein